VTRATGLGQGCQIDSHEALHLYHSADMVKLIIVMAGRYIPLHDVDPVHSMAHCCSNAPMLPGCHPMEVRRGEQGFCCLDNKRCRRWSGPKTGIKTNRFIRKMVILV
jgi:hypothetical protein